MNKLIDALNIITSLGWSKQLSEDHFEAMLSLRESAKLKTDDELSPEDLDVVNLVNKILNNKI
jgi:hypothetical protein